MVIRRERFAVVTKVGDVHRDDLMAIVRRAFAAPNLRVVERPSRIRRRVARGRWRDGLGPIVAEVVGR